MRRNHTILTYSCLFFILFLFALLPSILSTPTTALNFPAGKEDLYIQNNILFYEPGVQGEFEYQYGSSTTVFGLPCEDGVETYWQGPGFNQTRQEIEGLIMAAKTESSGVLNELTQMAILTNEAGWTNVADYVVNGGWFASKAGKAYNGPRDQTLIDKYYNAAYDILVNGHWTLPPGVNEHDCIYCGYNGLYGDGWDVYDSNGDYAGKQNYDRYDIVKLEQLDDNGNVVKTYDIAYVRWKNGGYKGQLKPGYTKDSPEVKYIMDHSNYVPYRTRLTNSAGSVYTFLKFQHEGSGADPMGYTKSIDMSSAVTRECKPASSDQLVGIEDCTKYLTQNTRRTMMISSVGCFH